MGVLDMLSSPNRLQPRHSKGFSDWEHPWHDQNFDTGIAQVSKSAKKQRLYVTEHVHGRQR